MQLLMTELLLIVAVKEQKKGKNKKRRRVYQELSSGESDKDATGIVTAYHMTLM